MGVDETVRAVAGTGGSLIEVTLPYPPSINHYYGRTRNGQIFIKTAGRDFRQRVADIVADARCTKQDGALAMFIWVSPPDKRKRDLDNIVKATQDALQEAGCYDNDCQIAGLHVERGLVCKGGKVFVQIVAHRTVSQTPYSMDDYPPNDKDV